MFSRINKVTLISRVYRFLIIYISDLYALADPQCQITEMQEDIHIKAWENDYKGRGRLWGSATKDLPELPAGSRILELGCGDGKTLAAMPKDWRMIALDVSPAALNLCRPALGSDIAFLLADACSLPFRSESFDAVFAFHVTGHLLLSGRKMLAREAARVLRGGGRLFFREFGSDDMRAGKGEEMEPRTFRRSGGILTHYFTKSEVTDLFCELATCTARTHRWMMRVKGRDLVRSQMEAVLVKR